MADDKDEPVESPEIHFEPIVTLPAVETKTMEEEERELLQLRSKLFRYDSEIEPPEWKERGTGTLKILQHKQRGTCRVLMRREKTLKICANHNVLPHMELKPNCGSDRAWVWSTPADFSDEEAKSELLAAKFTSAENAQKFKEKFEEAKLLMEERLKSGALPDTLPDTKDEEAEKSSEDKKDASTSEDKSTESVANQLEQLSVKETKDSEEKSTDSSTDSSEVKSKPEDQAER